ncbi:MAG: Gfo/Idh/MocA family oxidoreductase [Verrucomicrobiota bacterium]|nr:Gfo/Idh/MocA family oxidoreductase [Verrucomicrobiota bacterium]
MPKTKTFRAGVFSVVKHCYLPRAVAAHPRFELVVVTDDADQPDWVHERNQLFADEFGIPYMRDMPKAIAEYNLDLAAVSSEAERHCDLAVRAADAGLHVIADKPMSTRLSECDRLVEAVQRNNIKFLLWNRNYLPAVIQAKEAITSGAIGKLQAIHVDFYFSKDAGPPKGTRAEGDPPINWLERQIDAHTDGSDGGVGIEPMGELQIEGIYPLGYMHLLTGQNVERVFARTATHFHQANVDNHVDDLASVSLELENGIVGSLCIGRIGAASHPDIGEIKIHAIGSKGGIVISEARPEVSIHYRDQPPLEFKNERIASENDFLLMDDFARALDTGCEPILNAQAGRDIAATVFAAVESGKTGQPVEVTH